MLKTGMDAIRKRVATDALSDPDVVLYAARVSVWGRWFVWLVGVFLLAYRPKFWYPGGIELLTIPEPGLRRCAAGGGGQRLRPRRRTVQGDHDPRRFRPAGPLFTSGLIPGQRIELDTHEGLEIFERFRRMQEPLRSGDLAGHYRPTGVSGNRPGYADQLSQRARWELLSCQQAESGGVQPG